MISTIMPKISQSARRNTNSKKHMRELANQAARKKAPQSSFDIKQLRQAQDLDPDYNAKDLEFDSKTIIACNESVSLEIDELCGHNEKTLKEMQLCIEAASRDSQLPAQCNPLCPITSNSHEQSAICHPPLNGYANSFDTNLHHSHQYEVPPTTTSTKRGIQVHSTRKCHDTTNHSNNILDLKFKPFDGKLPSKDILKQSDGTIKISSAHNGLLYAAQEDDSSKNMACLSQLSYSVPTYMRLSRKQHHNFAEL